MSEQQEFCAGVKILLERMKTNPEDFGYNKLSPQTLRPVEPRFGRFADLMEGVITGRERDKLLLGWAEWHYLTKEEQSALIAGFKEMRRMEFDKRVMERVFDENYYQRQEQDEIDLINAQKQMFFPSTTNTTGNGILGGITNALGLK